MAIPHLKKSIALPSWISRLSARLNPAAVVGIALGRARVTAVRVSSDQHGRRLDWLHSVELSHPLFHGAPTPTHKAELIRVLTEISVDIQRVYVPIHVALPDALARFSVFELEAIPKTVKQRNDLVRLRAKESSADMALAWMTQPIGSEEKHQLLFAQGMETAWLRLVHEALEEVGIVPWSINSALCYRFNCFHDALHAGDKSGALVSIDSEYWSLVLSDAMGRLRYARGRWRRATETDEIDEIAVDVQRAIHAYIHSGSRRTVGRICVTGDAPDVSALASELDRRLQERCVVLSDENSFTDSEAISGKLLRASLALAAAASV